MALVVLLRGVNVGGHRTFRPAALAKALEHLDAVNIGAAGTFVVRRPVPVARLRAEFAKRLPFSTEIVICQGRDMAALLTRNPFGRKPARPGEVHFVSVMSAAPRGALKLPVQLPERGRWLLRLVAADKRFVFGQYRRDVKAVGYLGMLDKLLGVPVTTRNWNTISAIARVLEG